MLNSILSKHTHNGKILSLSLLRGLAAVMVCCYHFWQIPGFIFTDPVITVLGLNGYMGMHLFFFISGFIIPYSMYNAGYKLQFFWKFLAKRALRIEPPYMLSIVLALFIAYIATKVPGYRGIPFNIDPVGLLLHVGYLVRIFGKAWIDEVYWSLGVELEFYLFCALLFKYIAHRNQLVFLIPILLLVAIRYLDPYLYDLPYYCYQFITGILLFRFVVGLGDRRITVLLMVLSLGMDLSIHWFTSMFMSLGGVIIILFLQKEWAIARFLGKISYSLYLTHHIMGVRIINYIMRFNMSVTERRIVFFADLLICILFAWLFCLIVEQPSLRWASRIKYKEAK